ncbi:hypothetical protein AXF42_Ash016011 [Apostasia shenzhenica]|uniref:Uncharacterized protein n=1 Tax=Apostasia shenzhenica TaxID=1088818 RepID=A0A2I0AWM5_9ASPA|nr:hypothetical protein AXF42_Ash016011 [Apostasia shenzhenica]
MATAVLWLPDGFVDLELNPELVEEIVRVAFIAYGYYLTSERGWYRGLPRLFFVKALGAGIKCIAKNRGNENDDDDFRYCAELRGKNQLNPMSMVDVQVCYTVPRFSTPLDYPNVDRRTISVKIIKKDREL